MSTNRKRLNKAIQDIAKEAPEIRKLLDEFRNSGGKPGESATSGSGAEDRQICCDGSTGSGGANPGSGTRDPSDNPQDGIDSDDPAKISDNLTGVTDCATGQAICFKGNDWIPPDGWDSPTDPPVLSDYEEGFYYRVVIEKPNNSFSTSYVFTCSQAVGAINSAFPPCPEESWDSFNPNSCESASIGFSISHECYPGESGSFDKVECSESPNSICEQPPPTEEAWPSDGCTNLAIKGGKIVGSKYDPENDGSYSAPRDSIDLCDSQGNQISLSPSGSSPGGWKTINSTTDNGYLYDSSGQQIAHIDGNEYSDPSV